MRLSNLLHLYRIRVRARLVQELLVLVGIAVGVALLYAASVANTSLTESVERLTAGIVGNARFQIEARSADGFDARLLERVERLPGVQAAAPMLRRAGERRRSRWPAVRAARRRRPALRAARRRVRAGVPLRSLTLSA